GIQLTRSARALKIWLSIQYFGLDAFRAAIDRTLDLALHAEACIRTSPAFELVTPANLGIVCFRRLVPPGREHERSEINERLVAGLAASGEGMISSTRVHGEYTLRLCVLSYRTTPADVEHVLDWL